MSIQTQNFSNVDLDCFRQYQRRSFETLIEVGQTLKAGETEIQVARRIRKAFHQQGVHHYFHVPVALFGERTTYPGDFGEFEALATDKKLETGMPVILDAAPIYDGHRVMKVKNRPWNRIKIKQLGVRQVGWFYWKGEPMLGESDNRHLGLKDRHPGLDPGSILNGVNEMKEQNGFRIESGMTCATLTNTRRQ